MRGKQQHLGQGQTAALAARKTAYGAEGIVAEEAKLGQVLPHHLGRKIVAHRLDFLDGGAVLGKRAQLLIEVAQSHGRAALHHAGQGREFANQGLEQGALAAPVGAHDAHAIPAEDVDRHIGQDGLVRVADADARRAHDLLAAQIAAGFKVESDPARYLPVVIGTFQPLQLFQHAAPTLRLLGLLPSQVAPDEVFGFLDVVFLALVLDARPFQPRVALHHILVVGKGIADEVAVL